MFRSDNKALFKKWNQKNSKHFLDRVFIHKVSLYYKVFTIIYSSTSLFFEALLSRCFSSERGVRKS